MEENFNYEMNNLQDGENQVENYKSLMEAFLDSLKNSHQRDSDELELMLRNILELIIGVNNKEQLFSKEEVESDLKTFFYSKFVGGVVDAILHGIRYNKPNPMIKDIQREILQQLLKNFVCNMEDPQLIPMFENLTSIFAEEQNFYRNNDGREVAEEYLQKIYRDICTQGFKWRAEIQEGSIVDYLQTDSNSNKTSSSIGVSSWTRAKVISFNEENFINLKLLGSGEIINKISLFSPYILPFNTLSTDFDWRDEIKTGDEIDFLDNRSWYLSTVVDSCTRMSPDGSIRKYVKCGNRIFRPDGKCEDSLKRKYFGWSDNFDKEVSVHDPKIRRPNEYSKIINNYHLISTYPIDSRKFNEIESFIPFELNDSSHRFYMVPKKVDGRNVDVYYYLLINNFCNDEQGLSRILEIIISYKVNGENPINNTLPINYDMVLILIDVIFNIHNSLHIKFAKTYLKEFVSICFEILTKFSITEIRNFKRDKIESCIKKLKEILIKVYMDVDVNVLYDLFGVEFGLNCLKSSTILDKKLLGLKILTETLSDATRSGPGGSSAGGFHDKHLPAPFLMAKVLIYDETGSNIFDLLFGSQSHSQILNKTPDLVKTFFIGRVLTSKDIDKLMFIFRNSTDQEIKNSIFKSIANNTQHIGSELLIYLIRKIMQYDLISLTSMNLDLLISAFKSLPTYSIKEVAFQIGDFLFYSIFNSNEVTLEFKLSEQMSDEFVSLLKTSDFRDSVLEYIERIILLLKEEKYDFVKILKFLRKLLTSLFNIIDETKKGILLELILGGKNNIIDLAISYLTEYHSSCIKIKSNPNFNLEEDIIITLNQRINSTPHNETLSEITLLLSIFNSIKTFSFGYDHIHLLYRIFVEDAITSKDSNLFFKFLKEAEDSGTMPSGAFEIIFSKMIEQEDLEFSTSSISLDLFNTLWNIFTTINKNSNKLNINEYKGDATYSYSGISNSGQTLMSYSYNPDKKMNNDVSLIVSSPLELSGFDLIWKLMVSSPSGSEVNKKAVNSILKLFLAENKNLWNILIEKCIKTVNCVKQSLSEDFNSKKLKISNILILLKCLIEETEKKGTAGCISHSSILKNSKLKIIIKNMISPKLLNQNENFNSVAVKDSLNLKEFILVVYSNTTLWDLKKLISYKIGVIPEGLKFLNTGGKEITDNDHGKTLMELKIKDNQTLSVVKNPILDQIPKVSLIKDGQLVEKAVKAFSEIFDKFSTEGLMSKEQCAQFAYSAVDSVDPISPDDHRIKSVFEMHDTNKDGFLELDDFLSFFRSSIVDQKKPHIVWDNLRAFNYRNDLKKLNETLDIYNSQIELMPRFILSKNQEYFESIFRLQDDEEKSGVAKESSKFLSMICTNPIIFKEIILLNKNKIIDWKDYLDSSNPYKLLYTLQIIESFFEEFELDNTKVDSETLENTILDTSERELLLPNHKLIWIEKFLVQGGILHIINLLLNIQYSKYGINSQYRRCLNLLIKILKNSLTIIFRASSYSKSSVKNQKDEIIQLIRKESFEGEAIASNNLKSNKELSQDDHNLIKNIFNDIKSGNDELYNEEDSLSHNDNKKVKNDLEKNLLYTLNNYYNKDDLLKNIDLTSLSHKLISLSWEIMNKQETDLEERTLITNSINLLSLIIISQDNVSSFIENKIFNYQTEDLTFSSFILHGLVLSNLLTRLNFNRTFSNLSTQLCNLKEFDFTIGLYKILNSKITNLSVAEKSQSKYFFELFQSVMDNLLKIKSTKEKISNINFVELALNIVELFSKEKNIEEEVFIGYMKILNVILKNNDEKFKSFIGIEKGLINIIIDNFLIKDTNLARSVDYENLIKFKRNSNQEGRELSANDISQSTYSSGDCRLIIFNLLTTLISENLSNIQNFFSNEKISDFSYYLTNLKKDNKFYNPISDKRSMHCYAGIKNLQCICYMISVLQQFFSVPTFRYAIMQAEDQKPKPSGTDDNVLHQLQRMFTYLELTQRNEYNPVDFCYAFKDLGGNPTNVSIQQDAQEFLGRLFDIVENSLKSTAHKYIFQSVFLGKTCSQLICKGGCGKVRNTFEDFYNLSLEVQNRRSLKESLEKYISEDQIDDYYCDNCKKKTSVIRRTSFSSLPNVLIVHLQRILFNYESLMNEKINTRLEFPKRLDLKDYCTETLNKESNEQEQDEVFNQKVYEKENEYYKYELVGVVVHLGVAEAGHYYSYINVQREGNSQMMNFDITNEKDLNKWLTFNDSSVSSYFIKNLDEDCFGGSSKESENKTSNDEDLFSGWGPRNRNQNYDYENSKNAYMLVYERINKCPLKMTLITEDEIQEKINAMNIEVYNYNDSNKNEVLKKFDTFAKVSLERENTAVSRRDEETSNSTMESKGIYDYIFHNETNNEYIYYLPFYSLEPSVSSFYYNDVIKDNICFSNDQKIYSNNFSIFIEKTLENTVKILKTQQETSEAKQNDKYKPISEKDVSKIYFTCLKFLFEILSKSNFRENLKTIIDYMCEILRLYPKFSDSVLESLFSNKEKLNDLIFSSEESSNVSYKNLIVCTIIENFKVNSDVISKYLYSLNQENNENSENSYKISVSFIPYSISILEYLYSLLPYEASKQWTKIYAYLDLFSSLAYSNENLILEYMFKKETIYLLIDFMLGKESPYYNKNESRTEMGSRLVAPKFYPLISTISILVRHCGTKTWAHGEASLELVDISPPTTYINCKDKIFQMSDRDYDCLTETSFYKKAFKDSHYNLGMSRLIAHLMYKNYSYSKKRTYTIMESINEVIPTNEAKSAFDLIFHVLLIEDEFSVKRMEWIYGIPQINLRLNQTPSLPPRETKWGEKIIKYVSPLTYGTNHESLMEKLLHKYQASTDFITILNYFFGVIFSRRHILNYFDSLPHPRNDMQFMKSHVFYLGEQEMNRILCVESLATKYEKQIKGFTNILENYEKKKEVLNTQDDDESMINVQHEFKFSSKYKINNLVREHIQNIPYEELNKENLYCMIVDYDVDVISDNLQNIKEGQQEMNSSPEQEFTRSESFEPENNGYTLIKLQNEADNETYPLPPQEDQENNNDGSMEAVQGDDDREIRKENLVMSCIEEKKENQKDLNYNESQQKITQDNNISQSTVKYSNRNVDNRNKHKRSNSEEKEFLSAKVPPINISGGKIYSSQSSPDEVYFRQNFINIYQNETHTRTFINKSEICKSSMIVNCIKRYVLYNNSEKEYKARFRFFSKDYDFTNTYIPASELVIYSKKDSVNTIHIFSKDDIELPWSELGVEIDIEKYENSEEESKVNSNSNNNKTVKKSNSYDNLKSEEPLALPADSGAGANEGGVDDCFPIDCQRCGHCNYVSMNSPDYTCQKCKKDVWG